MEVAALLLTFVRVAVACTFILSVVPKTAAPAEFADSLADVLVPPRLRPIAAVSIMLLEASVSFAMVLGGAVLLFGLATAAVLLIGFSAQLGYVLHRGIQMPCRCFGRSAVPISRFHLYRNVGFLMVVAIGLAMTSLWRFPLGVTLGVGVADQYGGLPLISAAAAAVFTVVWSRVPEIWGLLGVTESSAGSH